MRGRGSYGNPPSILLCRKHMGEGEESHSESPSRLEVQFIKRNSANLGGVFFTRKARTAVVLTVSGGQPICRRWECGESRQHVCERDRLGCPHEQPAALGFPLAMSHQVLHFKHKEVTPEKIASKLENITLTSELHSQHSMTKSSSKNVHINVKSK